MDKLTGLIKHHQVVTFFVLTFAISWGLWIPVLPLVFSGKQPLLGALVLIAGFGPALAAIAVTRVIDQEPSQGTLMQK